MSRREQAQVTEAQAQRELRALDAALSGESVELEHEPLAQLALELRALREQPSGEFAQALDARAAERFRSGRAKGRHALRGDSGEQRGPGPARRARRGILARPALVAAALVVALAAVAVPLALTSHAHRAPRTSANAGLAEGENRATRHDDLKAAGSASAPAVPASEAPGGSTSAAASGGATPARQVERTATLELGVAAGAIQSAAQRVFSLVSAFGGYVRQSSVSSGSGSGSGSAQGGATFDARIPSDNLSGAIAALSHLGHVRSETNTTNDVTEQLGALRRSLADARAERSGLLKQIAAASEEARAAELRSRLAAVEAKIARLGGSLGALSARIEYTSLALSLAPESGAGAGANAGDLTPTGAARDAARILDAALAIVVLATAALLPLGIVLAALWWIATLGRRRTREHALDAS